MRNINTRLHCVGACLLLAVGTSFSTVARAGQGVWTSGGPYGGSISALAIDPANPATVYAGTNGGLYRSTNAGENWAPVNSGVTGWVGALVIDPANSATLYAATGNGVLKSTDRGTTWTAINTG